MVMGWSLGYIKTVLVSGAAKPALVATAVVVTQVAVITTVKLQSVHPSYVTGQDLGLELPTAVTLQTEPETTSGVIPVLIPTTTPVVGVVTPAIQPDSTTVPEGTMETESAPSGETPASQIEPTPMDSLLNDILIPESFGDRTPYIP